MCSKIEGMQGTEVIKNIGQSFKDVDVKAGVVTGFFSSFNYKDTDGDIIRKGSYAKTIAEQGPGTASSRIRHLLDHDKTKSVSRLTKLEEQDFGLYYESKAGRHTNGRDFLLMAEDGLITEHSVLIVPVREAFSEVDKANIMTEVVMWEGSSLQAWGANQWTPMTGVKSDAQLHDLFRLIEKKLKTGSYTDETMIELEAYYKNLGEYFKATLKPDAEVPTPVGEEKPEPESKGLDLKLIRETFKWQ